VPTIFSHAVAATAVQQVLPRHAVPRGLWKWTVVCSMLPDADVIGFSFGVRYGDMLGHRGLSHSLFAAAVVGLVVAWVVTRKTKAAADSNNRRLFWWLALYFMAVTASHGLLDACTNGGLGIAFLAPFSARRLFFPWTPIEVSPIGLGFFSERGASVVVSELRWIWLPAAAIALAARRRFTFGG
jgi:inner membrane protein